MYWPVFQPERVISAVDPERREENKDRAENRGSREIVRAVTENLWHRREKSYALGGRTSPPSIKQAGAFVLITLLPKTILGYCLVRLL